MQKLLDIIKDMVKSLRFIIPLVFIFGVIFAFYTLFTKADAEQTVEDVVYITKKIKEDRQETYFKDFNNDTVVYSNFLPIDLKTRMTDNGYLIRNRFGSTMTFTESYKTKEEKDFYMSVIDDPAAFEKAYRGTGAYTITFYGIRRSACMLLAQTDWKKKVPNFLGISVGRINPSNPKIGSEKLNLGLLYGLTKIDYEGPDDQAFVSNRTLQYREAFRACKCLLHNKCVVSLKFM
ncbi:MAG: hypothetical protein IJ532_07315 [Alphaproteobacteria bacterium]|nr:hypothetical protein [Alphaproteobacteria bacterium]